MMAPKLVTQKRANRIRIMNTLRAVKSITLMRHAIPPVIHAVMEKVLLIASAFAVAAALLSALEVLEDCA